jgi:hypothetical protein
LVTDLVGEVGITGTGWCVGGFEVTHGLFVRSLSFRFSFFCFHRKKIVNPVIWYSE